MYKKMIAGSMLAFTAACGPESFSAEQAMQPYENRPPQAVQDLANTAVRLQVAAPKKMVKSSR